MMKLNSSRLGLALGLTATLFYLGCVLLMALFGPQNLVGFFNGLFHGLNVAPIMNPNVTGWTALGGAISTFALSWAFGALTAVIHNAALPAATPTAGAEEAPARPE